MGFLSSLTGGSKTTSKTGYAAAPIFQQKNWESQADGVRAFLNPLVAGNTERFTPIGETADETAAYDLIRQGFTPTAEGLASDLQTLQNPYLSSVISEVNRQGQGQNSVLQQNLNGAGQLNSNRSILGANDIDLSRMNQIGGLLSDNYNTNLNYALNTLPALRAADATGLAGIGADQRNLAYNIAQAPVNALNAAAQINAGFPSSTEQTTKSSGGLLSAAGSIGGLVSGVGALGGLAGLTGTGLGLGQQVGSLLSKSSIGPYANFSDRRLKRDIQENGIENGHKTYKFKYMDDDSVYIGVMADEIIDGNPDAVILMDNGFYAVDYSKIGVNFRHG